MIVVLRSAPRNVDGEGPDDERPKDAHPSIMKRSTTVRRRRLFGTGGGRTRVHHAPRSRFVPDDSPEAAARRAAAAAAAWTAGLLRLFGLALGVLEDAHGHPLGPRSGRRES